MAKKSEIISFKNQNITYNENGVDYSVIHLKKPQMVVDLSYIEDEKKQTKTIPFAHLPKKIKQRVKSN